MRTRLIVYLLIFVIIIVNSGAQAKEYSVPASMDDTRVVDYESWDSYKIQANNRKVNIEVEVESGGLVDFYILTKSQFDDYINPEAPEFEFEEMEENMSSFSWSGSRGIYYLVIDNIEITVSGAVPIDDVTYQIDVTYSEINQFDTFIGFLSSSFNICFFTLCSSYGVCGVIILIAIINVAWLYRVPKEYRQKARQLKALKK